MMAKCKCIILSLILGVLRINGLPTKRLNIAIIGAGPSGLTSAKNALEQGHKIVVFEKQPALGGTWYYTDKSGTDEYGIFIHTAMYEGLRTNAPHQVMEFSDHKYPNGTRSYPPHEDVLKYLHSYSDRFDLRRHIKFHHLVENVHSIENDKWKVTVKNLPKNKSETLTYDAIFVCVNTYSSPNYPKIEGANEFMGKIIHSHDYRRAEDFRGADVLIIGGKASGTDLVDQLSKIANRIIWSRRAYNEETEKEKDRKEFATFTNDVKRFTANGAKFLDGTYQNITDVIYATGYKYYYPFLDASTGIHVDDNYVQPLYKEIINIEHPTMAFIGIIYATGNRVFELQARFALKFISGAKKLPSKSEMLNDMHDYEEAQQKKGLSKRKRHRLSSIDEFPKHFEDLARIANVTKIPNVYSNMYIDSGTRFFAGEYDYREYRYTVVDDETFIREKEV